jgi:Mg2+ and Co2+ transporter CorA
VSLPGDGGLAEFWLLVALMTISTIGAVVYFRRRGWL